MSDPATDAHEPAEQRRGPAAPHRPAPPNRAHPAWRTVASLWAGQDEAGLSPVELEGLRPLDPATDRNTEAEYGLYRLPSRFLRYAAEVGLRRSVLGSAVVWVAGEDEAGRIAVPFPATAMEECLDAFAVARQAPTLLPVEAAGPELPAADADEGGSVGGA